ncbi:MAG: hypothetical protein OXG78_02805 [Chloroflexi bacterium]|nr:hypothetical protein [Chloroflexota bacterium]
MSREYSLERDLAELEQMAERLEEYILSERLYLPLSAGYARSSTLPQLSIGMLLLRRRRLKGLRASLNPAQQKRLDAALQQHDAVQREWTVHYEHKLKGELPARLKQMRAFFRDCQDNPTGCASAYPPEALRRAIVQEILLALEEFGYERRDITPGVEQTDIALRRLVRSAGFIWSSLLKPLYPPSEFWWLFARPA